LLVRGSTFPARDRLARRLGALGLVVVLGGAAALVLLARRPGPEPVAVNDPPRPPAPVVKKHEPPPDDPTEPDRVLILGDDQAGVPLEILVVEEAAGDVVVIHAMKMRSKYRRQYEEALPWRIVP